jgi:hypothetical protein
MQLSDAEPTGISLSVGLLFVASGDIVKDIVLVVDVGLGTTKSEFDSGSQGFVLHSMVLALAPPTQLDVSISVPSTTL